MRITNVLPALALSLAAACASLPRAPGSEHYDILITNARIVDGTGNPWYRGAVATRGDRIAYVGPAISGLTAKRVIDAHDQVGAPGFIDMLGHSEFELLRGPHAISKITQGITSEVTGEVHSAWPQVALGDNPDPRYPWRSLGEYFATLEKSGTAINLGTYVGTSSVRQAVMGDVTRHPSDAEMKQMGALIDSAMRDGAFGVGTGLIYLPSTFFTTDELIALTKYATPYKGGYAAHIRNEGNELPDAVRETIRIATGAGTWAEIRHLKARSLPLMQQAVALIDSARAAGIDISADQYPYIASATGLAAMLNTWVQEGGSDSMVVRLRDPAVRARLKMELGQDSAQGIRTAAHTMINDVVADSLKNYEGMLLTDVGK